MFSKKLILFFTACSDQKEFNLADNKYLSFSLTWFKNYHYESKQNLVKYNENTTNLSI